MLQSDVKTNLCVFMKVCKLVTKLFAKYHTIAKLPTVLDSFCYATSTYIGEEWRWQGTIKVACYISCRNEIWPNDMN